MANVVRGVLGAHVPLVVYARERRTDAQDGRKMDLNGIRTKSVKDPAGTALAVGLWPAWAYAGRGEYVAQWDTSTLTVAGDYLVEIEGATGWDTVNRRRINNPGNIVVRLVRQGAN